MGWDDVILRNVGDGYASHQYAVKVELTGWDDVMLGGWYAHGVYGN